MRGFPVALLTAVVAWAGLGVQSARAAIQYKVIDLGTEDMPLLFGHAINNSGQVTGEGFVSRAKPAVLWEGGTVRVLGWPDESGNGLGISGNGKVTGSSGFPQTTDHAFLYSDGVMKDLGTLGGSQSEGCAVNNSGQVAGWSSLTSNNENRHAILYSGGVMRDLGTLGGPNSWGYGINASGQVTGAAQVSVSEFHAFIYSDGVMKDLGKLGGHVSEGECINDKGEVAGWSNPASGDLNDERAFLYTGGRMRDLGTLGGTRSRAWGINNNGDVVGHSTTVGVQGSHAFLYTGGEMRDLNSLIDPDLGWTLQYAYGINDAGWITGDATDAGGHLRGYVLAPVPEPAGIVVWAGLMGLMAIRRRGRIG